MAAIGLPTCMSRGVAGRDVSLGALMKSKTKSKTVGVKSRIWHPAPAIKVHTLLTSPLIAADHDDSCKQFPSSLDYRQAVRRAARATRATRA